MGLVLYGIKLLAKQILGSILEIEVDQSGPQLTTAHRDGGVGDLDLLGLGRTGVPGPVGDGVAQELAVQGGGAGPLHSR